MVRLSTFPCHPPLPPALRISPRLWLQTIGCQISSKGNKKIWFYDFLLSQKKAAAVSLDTAATGNLSKLCYKPYLAAFLASFLSFLVIRS